VPVIDLSPLFSEKPDPSACETVRQQIDAASKKWGFYQVINHQVPGGLIHEAEEQMRKFFQLPNDIKSEILRTPQNYRGYFNDEFTKNKLDVKEGFDYSAWDITDKDSLVAINRWPSGEPEMTEIFLKSFRASNLLAEKLMEVYALNLNKPKDFFREFFQEGEHLSFVRLNYYPLCPDSDRLGVGPHQDSSALTILKQDDDVSGLQVFIDDAYVDELSHLEESKWVTIEPVKDALVVNVGAMLEVWSNSRYKAALHRVLASKTKVRYSTPFFYLPSMETNVVPILLPGENQVYKVINFGDYRRLLFKGFYEKIPLHQQARLPNFRIKEN